VLPPGLSRCHPDRPSTTSRRHRADAFALASALLVALAIACGGDEPDAAATNGEASRLTLDSTRKTPSPLTIEAGGVKITASRVSVADYDELYETADDKVRQALDGASEAKDAVTVGLIELSVENASGASLSYDPRGSVIVGNEHVTFSPPFSSDLSGEYAPGLTKRGLLIFFLKTLPATSVSEVVYVLAAPPSATSGVRELQMRFPIAD
jgi:hypothetical protein